MEKKGKPRLQLLLAALLFSTGGAAIKACTLTAWQVASFRSGVAVLALLLLDPQTRRGWTWRTWLVGIAYAATVIFFVLATKLTTSANAIFLQSTAPLYLLLLGPWLLKEPVRLKDLPFLLAVGIGLALFFVGNQSPLQTAPDPNKGNWIAVASGVSWAFTLAGLRWLGADSRSEGETAQGAAVAGNLIAFLIALPWALPMERFSAADAGGIIFLGVIQIGVAYSLLARGIRNVPALEASLLLLLEPAINPIWAWIIHGEIPSAWAVAGGVLILGATSWRASMSRMEVSPSGK